MAKARKNQIKNNRIAKNRLQKLFQMHKIRECYIKVIRLEDVIQEENKIEKALLKKHGIRECKVVLKRCEPLKIQTPTRKLILKPNESVTVRSNVAWLPKISNKGKKSVKFSAECGDQEKAQKGTEKLQGHPMKRPRANSMFEERSDNRNVLKPSMADFHREMLEKRDQLSPVRKIRPQTHREMIPVWIQIRDEIQKKLEAKKQSKKLNYLGYVRFD